MLMMKLHLVQSLRKFSDSNIPYFQREEFNSYIKNLILL